MTGRHSMTRLGTVRGAREDAGRPAPGWPAVVLRVVGSGLLIATAAIHLDLYLTGYRTIPTIGWLFLLQVIAAFGLGLAVLAIPRLAGGRTAGQPTGGRGGAGFALATLGGYLLSVWIGLFGFKEVRTTAGIAAGLVEVAAFVVLAALALAPAPANRGAAAPARFPAQIPPAAARAAGMTAAGLAAAALVLFGLALTGANSTAATATATGTGTHGPEDRDDQRDHGTDQRQGLHALLVRPRHPDRFQVLRQLRRVLAPGDRHHRGRAGPARQGRHDQANRRHRAAHLQRAPAIHLHRRLGPRPGQGQQPQPQRRTLERGPCFPVSGGPPRPRRGGGEPTACISSRAVSTRQPGRGCAEPVGQRRAGRGGGRRGATGPFGRIFFHPERTRGVCLSTL